jgi:hypothetical protein
MQPLGLQGMCGLHTVKKACCEAQRPERILHGIEKQINRSLQYHLIDKTSARI